MAKITFSPTVSINNCKKLIATVGRDITVILKSEPGCGKSSLLGMLQEEYGDKYEYIYVDCPVKDMADIGMAIPVHETRQLEFYASSLFKLDSPKPKIVMLDEFMKAPKLLQVIFTRVMLERMIGDRPLPPGSIVFGTSNNTSDGVGDVMLAHAANRVMLINMKKPDHKEWGLWATDHDISALTRAWVALNPACMNSYTELTEEELKNNPFIFDPKKNVLSFCSPRSLAKNDVTVRNKVFLGEEVTRAAMAGTIGSAAAESMAAFFLIEKDLISTQEIIKNPKKVPIPENTGALLMILFNAVDEILTQDDMSAFMEFVLRLKSDEMQSVFYTMACQSRKTIRLAKNNKQLADWMLRNFYLFT